MNRRDKLTPRNLYTDKILVSETYELLKRRKEQQHNSTDIKSLASSIQLTSDRKTDRDKFPKIRSPVPFECSRNHTDYSRIYKPENRLIWNKSSFNDQRKFENLKSKEKKLTLFKYGYMPDYVNNVNSKNKVKSMSIDLEHEDEESERSNRSNDNDYSKARLLHLNNERSSDFGFNFRLVEWRGKTYPRVFGIKIGLAAFEAGLCDGDYLLEMNGQPLCNVNQAIIWQKISKNPKNLDLFVVDDLNSI